MKIGPDIAGVASLIGDPARANMLTALMDGAALTASELAAHAGITKQTASAHLAKLVDGALLVRDVQGRHHYFRLEGPDVAAAIEAIMGIAQKRRGVRTRPGPADPALRKARVCYDHLAGEVGVLMFDRFVARGWAEPSRGDLTLTAEGRAAAASFGIDVDALSAAKRPLCRSCLDWSERRHHLAGGIGKALFTGIVERGWAARALGTRIVRFSDRGERELRAWLG